MKKTSEQDALMIRYLLGEVTEEEQLRLEEQFFTDDESYQQLLALEDELKYEYAQGGLTPGQRKSFEQRFLSTPEGRQKVALAGAILAKAYEVRGQALRDVAEPAAWWQSLRSFFTLNSPSMQFAFATASMLLLVAGSWFMYQTVRLQNQVRQLEAARRTEAQQSEAQRTRQEQLNQELAKERDRRGELERELSKRPTSSSFLSFVLIPGLTRDAEGPKRLSIPADAGEARLQLDVKSKSRGDYKRYRAELATVEGDQIWSQDVSQPAIAVPARLLPAGDYVVVLKGLTATGDAEPVGEYYFVVVRK